MTYRFQKIVVERDRKNIETHFKLLQDDSQTFWLAHQIFLLSRFDYSYDEISGENLKTGKIRILTEELCQIEAVSENLFKERNIRKSFEIMTLFTVAKGKKESLTQGISTSVFNFTRNCQKIVLQLPNWKFIQFCA